ncbi:hypothetical protein KKF91_00190 [Myxococcota bacterium]|nr:hypothetical protein [Myxococcota bacterium]MBU1428953.1 hypothetical protein [Myxococcota bacterium]MBU1897709.1 hypothetical protein [Myxococcota bacterium]
MALGTRRRAQILTRRALPLEARAADGRYNAEALLDAALLEAPPDTFRLLVVTDAPLNTPAHERLVGYARGEERGLIFSTQGLPRVGTEAAHRRRTRRVVLHELGHTFGIGHCPGDCVMRDSPAQALDLLADGYCPLHRPIAEAGLAERLGDVRFLSRLALERMRLARWGEAVAAFRAALKVAPGGPRLWTGLGISLMADGQLLAADEAFEMAHQIAPQAPQPFYARAILYGAGFDPQRAEAFIEAAVDRDGRALRAHRAAGIFYQDVLGNKPEAIRHYQRHVELGGRDERVIGRLVYLLSPSTLVFTRPELIIARWDSAEGLILARAHAPEPATPSENPAEDLDDWGPKPGGG